MIRRESRTDGAKVHEGVQKCATRIAAISDATVNGAPPAAAAAARANGIVKGALGCRLTSSTHRHPLLSVLTRWRPAKTTAVGMKNGDVISGPAMSGGRQMQSALVAVGEAGAEGHLRWGCRKRRRRNDMEVTSRRKATADYGSNSGLKWMSEG